MATSSLRVPTEFDPKDWPFYWMTQTVSRYLQRLERELKPRGLDVSRWRVLMSVGNRKIAVSEIAELAIVKLPTMMKIIRRMEIEGLVECERRRSDGRVTDVSLTARGRDERAVIWAMADRIYAEAFQDLSTQDSANINAMLERIFLRLGGA